MCDYLRTFPIFAGLTERDVEELLRETQLIRYRKGETVFSQGGEAASFFLLKQGRLRVVKVTLDGRQVVVRYVVPGDIFGVAMAFGRETYPASAVAVADSVVLAWPSAAWPRLATKFPQLTMNTLQAVGRRLYEAHDRVVEASTERVELRVAHALLRLAAQSPVVNGRIDLSVSRQDLAEMAGTTLFSVSRILKSWEGRSLVVSGRQRVTILNIASLQAFVEQTDEHAAKE
jgi:CRP-like cAMP-binding protein